MLLWLKYRLFGKEMRELAMWRHKHSQYTQWLSDYEDVSLALKGLGDEVRQDSTRSRSQSTERRPMPIMALLDVLRYKKYRNNATPIPSSFFEKEQ